MAKKVIIEISLVPEALRKRSEEIEEEIWRGFREGSIIIPWSFEIEKIRVT